MASPLPEPFDLIVVGATPAGIACAVRAAREGLRVLLTNRYRHIGGMLANGLGCLDTQYAGRRAPLYSEFCDRLLGFYERRYGRDSSQYRSCFAKSGQRLGSPPASPAPTDSPVPPPPGSYYGKLNFEPHAAEAVLGEMVAAEANLTLWLECTPIEVARQGRLLTSARWRFSPGQPDRVATARVFADCTYEGDLLALAGCPYRVGREARAEYGEQHAGRIFTALHFATADEVGYPRDAVEGRLNLEPYEAISQEIHAGSTGEGDRKVQSYTFRLCLSRDPGNRMPPERPPGYNREIFLRMRNRWSLGAPIANDKLRWNTSNLPGASWDYPEAGWEQRAEILRRHRDHALGFLWFLQHDEAVPAALQAKAREYGLARDEFTDNGHVPWEVYVREARRLSGRYVFREQDATLGPGLGRAPIHRDSIATTDWGMDSHSVSMEITAGSRREGKILLSELTRPAQVPWRCLLPSETDNLLVPVCLSATHVGWGTLRLEPAWMHIAESAGWSAVLACRERIAPATLKVGRLQRLLVERGVMISFFNDFDMGTAGAWVPAVQFLGAKWFFASYDARPADPLDLRTAKIWAGLAADLLAGRHRHLEEARWGEIFPEPGSAPLATAEEFRSAIERALQARGLAGEALPQRWTECAPVDGPWRRGQACLLFYQLLRP